ncbi:MAG TPA: ATP-binding protein [Fluviicola sp.]|nr:ATP-binding protein [Fluviicola sp.]
MSKLLKIKRLINKKSFFTVAIIACVFLIGFYLKHSDTPTINSFQQAFTQQEQKQQKTLKIISKDWFNLSDQAFYIKYKHENDNLFIHVFRNDSLVFWNTNKCPINRFAELHFPVNGIIKLQNGWYYSQFISKNNLVFAVTFGIKRQFPIKNNLLTNYFFEPFPQTQGEISMITENQPHVVNLKKMPVFSFQVTENPESNTNFFYLLFGIILTVFALVFWKISRQINSYFSLISILVILIGLRFLLLELNLFSWLGKSTFFDPSILALNQFIPNFGELFLWFYFLFLIAPLLLKWINALKGEKIYWILFLIIPSIILVFPQLTKQLILNSTIPIHLSDLLKLNLFSGIFIFMVALTGFFVYLLFYKFFKKIHKFYSLKHQFFLHVGCIGIVALVNEYTYRLHGFWIIWMCVLMLLAWFFSWKKEPTFNFSNSILILFVLAFGITLNFEREALKKEKEERLLFANQLADDQDINAEVDYISAREKIKNEPFIKRLFNINTAPRFLELKEAMEFQVFNGYWDRYDVDCYYFKENDHRTMNGFTQEQLDELIQYHGIPSEIDSSLVYIRDYTSQFTYMFRFPIEKDGNTILFYGTLKSKRIPEKIGLPKILVSKQTAVYELLESYSIAKYYNNQLVLNYGIFEFPTSLNQMGGSTNSGYTWITTDGFDHLVYIKSKSDAIILSKESTSWLSYLTSTAFLMVCFGLFLFFTVLLVPGLRGELKFGFSMVTKIQLVIVSLIFLSLFGFSFSSSYLLTDQYSNFSKEQIREKLKSVTNGTLSIFHYSDSVNKEEINYELEKLSAIFRTDINLFRPDGVLIAASRNKIYKMGLLSEQMNPDAFYALHFKRKSEFIHVENIGKLTYLSGYVPLFDHHHHLKGFLNILHFDQKNAFENQMRQFFVGILNVFMLLLVITVLVAIFASTWISKPLILLRNSFSKVEFGKNNQHIEYEAKDEIGALVAEYNLKLDELTQAAIQLAQSERESAWREMAKQVAHEIKNPLTPMKLSVQHLQRVFDPNDVNIQDKINKVTRSLIEQIDTLTSIANEFSNFAKLPQPKLEELLICDIVQKVVTLFETNDQVQIKFTSFIEESTLIYADKEHILRILNNLITNGIQAVKLGETAIILIEITQTEDFVTIAISDNGCGIEKEQLSTIFEPYFTTKSTGTGLGLAMVKQLVELHHGQIEISATSHQGTTMEVKFPIRKSSI